MQFNVKSLVALFVGVVGAATLAPNDARAEADASTFIKEIDGGNKTVLWNLYGYANGFGWYQSHMEGKPGFRKQFCEPQKLAITPDQNYQIFKKFVEANPEVAEFPAGMILLYAYIETFPCEAR